MARPSVIPQIKKGLETYLDKLEEQWLEQPENARTPTLPLTSAAERKVNVRAIAQALGLSETQEKYLYERDELKSEVNMLAEAQGVLGIGSRLEPADLELRNRIVATATQAKVDAQAAVESSAALSAALSELAEAQAENQRLKLENASLREQLNLARQGIVMGV